MKSCRLSPVPRGRVAASLIVAVALVLGATYGQGQPPGQRQAGGMPAEQMAPVQQPKQFRGRVPAYYSTVVDDRQREQIYAIQRRYFAPIEDLKAQLEALTEKRDAEVAAVLSPQQQAEVMRLQAEAKAKRRAKKKMGKAAAR
jgi:hypothetical protein